MQIKYRVENFIFLLQFSSLKVPTRFILLPEKMPKLIIEELV